MVVKVKKRSNESRRMNRLIANQAKSIPKNQLSLSTKRAQRTTKHHERDDMFRPFR